MEERQKVLYDYFDNWNYKTYTVDFKNSKLILFNFIGFYIIF